MTMNADCHYGDHTWAGTSQCECGARLRCQCGCLIREDRIDDHLYSGRCRFVRALDSEPATEGAQP